MSELLLFIYYIVCTAVILFFFVIGEGDFWEEGEDRTPTAPPLNISPQSLSVKRQTLHQNSCSFLTKFKKNSMSIFIKKNIYFLCPFFIK